MGFVRKKVLLIELNEITWTLIDPLIAQAVADVRAAQARGRVGIARERRSAAALDRGSLGRPSTRAARRRSTRLLLQQPPETIRARRIWDRGRGGPFGRRLRQPLHFGRRAPAGFYVPDTFAPSPETHPRRACVRSQQLNLTYTRSVRLSRRRGPGWPSKRNSARGSSASATPQTRAPLARQLARERVEPKSRWRQGRAAAARSTSPSLVVSIKVAARLRLVPLEPRRRTTCTPTGRRCSPKPSRGDRARRETDFRRRVEYGYRTGPTRCSRACST